MDDRQRQIKEGAGLEESRLNVEFLNWLRVWGPRFLTVVLIVLAVYVGWTQLQRYRKSGVDKSFAEYELLVSDPMVTPEALLDFARGHSNTPGLVAASRLMAGDLFMNAVRTGVEPGSSPTPDGSYLDTDLLTPARRDELLGKAEAAFEQTLSQAKGKAGLELHAINALFGLAAASETRGDWAKAESYLAEAKATCEAAHYDALAIVAAGRIARLPELKTPPRLYAQSELPKPVEPPAPTPPPEVPGETPTGETPAGETPDTPPSGDQPTGDQPTGDAPTGDQPVSDQPLAGQPGANQPPVDPANPAPVEPAPTEPAPGQPTPPPPGR